MRWLLLFAICTLSCLDAQPSPTPYNPSTLSAGRVDLFTGEYIPDQSDLVVRGADPLTLPRFHRSHDDGGNCGGRWHLGEERIVVADQIIWLQQTNGSVIEFQRQGNQLFSSKAQGTIGSGAINLLFLNGEQRGLVA